MNTWYEAHHTIRRGDYPYYRRTWRIVVSTLLLAAFVPMLLLGGGMYALSKHHMQARTLEQLQIQLDYQAELLEREAAALSGDQKAVQEILKGLQADGWGRLLLINPVTNTALTASDNLSLRTLLSVDQLSKLQTKGVLEDTDRLYLLQPLPGNTWQLGLEADIGQVFSGVRFLRIFFLAGMVLGGIIIIFAVLLTTDYLVRRLETKRRALLLLDRQNLQVSRKASTMQLCPGFLQGVKDSLLNIDALSLTLGERDHPSDPLVKEIRSHLKEAVGLIDRFLGFIRLPGTAWRIQDIQFNSVLEELLNFCRHELTSRNISVHKEFDSDLPVLRSNVSRLHQMLLNLFLTVLMDIAWGGELRIASRSRGCWVVLELSYPCTGRLRFPLNTLLEHFQNGSASHLEPWPALCLDLVEKLQGSLNGDKNNGDRGWLRLELPFELIR